jgi:hypothetical protein
MLTSRFGLSYIRHVSYAGDEGIDAVGKEGKTKPEEVLIVP